MYISSNDSNHIFVFYNEFKYLSLVTSVARLNGGPLLVYIGW